MQQKPEPPRGSDDGDRSADAAVPCPDREAGPSGGCYGVQILVAGRGKPWRDRMSTQIRRAGFSAITADSAVDALTVLALGLPVDVLLTDADLRGDLDCARLAAAARELRPNLRIVLARGPADDEIALVPDAMVLSAGAKDSGVASTLREALHSHAA